MYRKPGEMNGWDWVMVNMYFDQNLPTGNMGRHLRTLSLQTFSFETVS